MSKIVIDARELRTTTGRYVERLLHYLQEIDNEHKYVVLLKPKDLEEWKPKNRKFAGMACYFKEFTFAEQIGLLKQIRDINADLVHFPMAQQPILYRGPVVTTMNDLTTVRFRNPTKNWLVFTIKRWVYIWVNKIVARKSKALLTYSEFVKEDVAKFAHVNSRKITVTYLAADKITDEPEPIEELAGKRF
ncbi:MAG TPA: glycosyltransferase, partial [Patescibacteria group bacterium]|nr:glycosyltransferase [Patescibacteria group bacterium]